MGGIALRWRCNAAGVVLVATEAVVGTGEAEEAEGPSNIVVTPAISPCAECLAERRRVGCAHRGGAARLVAIDCGIVLGVDAAAGSIVVDIGAHGGHVLCSTYREVGLDGGGVGAAIGAGACVARREAGRTVQVSDVWAPARASAPTGAGFLAVVARGGPVISVNPRIIAGRARPRTVGVRFGRLTRLDDQVCYGHLGDNRWRVGAACSRGAGVRVARGEGAVRRHWILGDSRGRWVSRVGRGAVGDAERGPSSHGTIVPRIACPS